MKIGFISKEEHEFLAALMLKKQLSEIVGESAATALMQGKAIEIDLEAEQIEAMNRLMPQVARYVRRQWKRGKL